VVGVGAVVEGAAVVVAGSAVERGAFADVSLSLPASSQAAAMRANTTSAANHSTLRRGRNRLNVLPPWYSPIENSQRGALAQQPHECDCRYREHTGDSNRDPVEIALDHIGSREATAHTSTEHVRQTSTTTRVEQDEEDETERHENLDRVNNYCQDFAFPHGTRKHGATSREVWITSRIKSSFDPIATRDPTGCI
jgi:hypothetical protein